MPLEQDLATLNLHLDKHSETALYVQLAEEIRRFIHSRRLAPGCRLPSTRRLAESLKVSRTSCINAYEQLIAEGVLVTRPSSGVFVSALGAQSQEQQEPCSDTAETEEAAAPSAFDSGPDVELFPFADWARSAGRVWRNSSADLLRVFPQGGYRPLQEAVAQYLKTLRGIECSPQQVIITAGNRDALALVSGALLKVDGKVALEDPCYPPLHYGLQAQDKTVLPCRVDGQGACLPEENVGLAWLTAVRQYPLGITMSMERRLAWLEYMQACDGFIVEDDFDAEFHYHKAPLAPLFALSAQRYPQDRQNVVLAGSFSKVLFRTLRLGYLLVPRHLIETFHQVQAQLGNIASLPMQPVLADFMQNRRFATHMRKMKRIYQRRRDFLHKRLYEALGDRFDIQLPDSGMHLLIRPKQAQDEQDRLWETQLAEQGVHAPALSRFYRESGRQGLILGFSGVGEEQLADGVAVLKALVGR